jgi:uncharacterized delta-60 repeat protein
MGILSSNVLRYNGFTEPVQSGLITWLDANFPSSITVDSLNRVSAWNTRTDNSTNYLQTTQASQPIYTTTKNINNIVELLSNGLVTSTINFGSGFNDRIYSTDIQSDGKILVGGSFTTYNGTTSNRIVRLNSDGSLDTSFTIGTGFNSTVFSITVQSDGKILVGGAFTSYNGTTSNRIIRLNSDGSIDTGFTIGTGFNSDVFEIEIQSDGKILLCGIFTSYNGTTSNRIIRLNTDGTLDTGFNIGTGFNGTVRTIKIQSDGKILVGGTFTSYNGTTRNNIARLNTNGDFDTGFNIGTGFNGRITAIGIQSDGKILAGTSDIGGGAATSYNGNTVTRIARLNSDGTFDISLTGLFSTGYAINKIIIDNDNNILVGGLFDSLVTVSPSIVKLLQTNLSVVSDFISPFPETFSTQSHQIYDLLILNNKNILIVGELPTINTNKYIQFDGIDDFLELGANSNYVSDVQTTFIVCEPDVLGNGVVLFRHAYNNRPILTGFFNQSFITFHARNSSNTLISSSLNVGAGTTYQVGKKSLLLGEWKADDTVLITGGETFVGQTATGANDVVGNHFRSRIASSSGVNPGAFWPGKFYEVLFYTRELTQLEIRQNYNYLAHKWGLVYE